MADQWFYAWDTKRLGPFSAAQLRELVALGRLQPTDTVWKGGIEKGVLATKVQHLFPAPQAQAPSANPNAPVANEIASPLQLSEKISSLIPKSGARLDPSATAKAQDTSDDQVEAIYRSLFPPTGNDSCSAGRLKPHPPSANAQETPDDQVEAIYRTLFPSTGSAAWRSP